MWSLPGGRRLPGSLLRFPEALVIESYMETYS